MHNVMTWIVTADNATANQAVKVIESDERMGSAGVCFNPSELAAHLRENPISIVIVDIDPDPSGMLAELHLVIDTFVHSRFVVIASEMSSDLMMEAMQAGVRNLVLKKDIDKRLCDTLARIAPAHTATIVQGKAVTVLSASGGCGATTVAVNLTSELQLLCEDPVLLVDLDTRYGTCANYLGLKADYGIADVLARAGDIDFQMLNSTAAHFKDRFDVLVSPMSIDFSNPQPLVTDRFDELMHAANQAYRYTVIDAPTVSMDAATHLIKNSVATLIVFQMTVKDIHIARSMIRAMVDRGIARERILPVANRFRSKRSEITLDETLRALSVKDIYKLPNDFRSAVQSINYGEPLSQNAPRSPLRRDLQELAKKISAMSGKNHVSAAA